MNFLAVFKSLWARTQPRVCLLLLALFAGIALAGYAGLLPDHEAAVGGSQDVPAWSWPLLLGTESE